MTHAADSSCRSTDSSLVPHRACRHPGRPGRTGGTRSGWLRWRTPRNRCIAAFSDQLQRTQSLRKHRFITVICMSIDLERKHADLLGKPSCPLEVCLKVLEGDYSTLQNHRSLYGGQESEGADDFIRHARAQVIRTARASRSARHRHQLGRFLCQAVH